jgi:hypothetical protein
MDQHNTHGLAVNFQACIAVLFAGIRLLLNLTLFSLGNGVSLYDLIEPFIYASHLSSPIRKCIYHGRDPEANHLAFFNTTNPTGRV